MNPQLEIVVGLIREFGFPVVVCMWLMWMYMRRENRMADALDKIHDVLVEVDKRLDTGLEEIHDELSGRHEGPRPVPLPAPKEGQK